nr:151_t:CDS:2 [Entrophospora candida]
MAASYNGNGNNNNNDDDADKDENIIHRLISTKFIPVRQFYAIGSYYQKYHQIMNNDDYFDNNYCDDANEIAAAITATSITSSYNNINISNIYF